MEKKTHLYILPGWIDYDPFIENEIACLLYLLLHLLMYLDQWPLHNVLVTMGTTLIRSAIYIMIRQLLSVLIMFETGHTERHTEMYRTYTHVLERQTNRQTDIRRT